jgi:hypothetical protein
MEWAFIAGVVTGAAVVGLFAAWAAWHETAPVKS